MKFLHTGDLHIGRGLDMKSLMEDQKFILDKIVSIAKDENTDFIIIAGDIFDRSVPREEAIELFDDFITTLVIENKIKVYAISGNHDSSSRLEGMNNLLKRAGYFIEGKLSYPPVSYVESDEHGDVMIHMIPFKSLHTTKVMLDMTESKDTTEIYTKLLDGIDTSIGRHIAVLHNYFSPNGDSSMVDVSDSERPLNIGGEEIIDSKILDKFNYTALGHLHKAQRVGSDKIRYAGSILKYSTSEINHNKSITLVNLDAEGNVRTELKELTPLRDFRKLSGLLSEVSSINFDDNKDDYLTINLTDEVISENPYHVLSAIYPNLIGITFENIGKSIENGPDIESIAKEDTFKLFGEFFESSMNREMNEKESIFMEDVIRTMEDEINDPN